MSRQLMPLERCEVCRGAGVIRGIFHTMECAACNGGGFVQPDGSALEYPALVAQLRLRLADAMRKAERPKEGVVGGPARDYEGAKNRRGIGGGNWTGD